MSKTIGTWYGEPIEELPEEKKLEVIEFLSNELKRVKEGKESAEADFFKVLEMV